MARGDAADVAGEAHRPVGLQQQPVLADAAGPDRPLGHLEGQQGQLGRRRHEAQVGQRHRVRVVGRQDPAEPGDRVEHLGELRARTIAHGRETFRRLVDDTV